MMAQLLQEEADAVVNEGEELMILVCFLRLHQLKAVPQCGCSRVGKRVNKDRQRMTGVLMLETNFLPTSLHIQPRTFNNGLG
jgi:hypothetical protein